MKLNRLFGDLERRNVTAAATVSNGSKHLIQSKENSKFSGVFIWYYGTSVA